MKQKLTFLLLLLISSFSYLTAQDSVSLNDRFSNSAQFLFNDYQNADIYLKNGKITNTDINYNVFFQEIWYKDNNQYFVINEPNKIEYIEFANFNLVILNKKIYETIAYSNKYKILKHREINFESINQNNGVYGTSTTTASADYLTTYITRPDGINNIKKESEEKFELLNRFFISDNDGNIYNLTKRRLYRLFKNNKNSIKTYFKENNINLHNEKDIIDLFRYIVSL